MIPFVEALASRKILIADGATGTELAARCEMTGPMTNLEHPETVKAVHADYKAAGASIILTNTLSGNRIALEHAGLTDRILEINQLGVKLCREAVGDDRYVGGDMSSTGKFMEPLGDYTEQQFYDNFVEQAELLADSGVDFIIIETMTDVRETAVAVRAVKAVSGLPVIASISFDPAASGAFRTMMGDTPEKAVAELTEAGADVIGANCGTLDPCETASVIADMRAHTDLPLIAMPNAGKPELSAGQVMFKLSPEEFADGAIKCIEAGATIVGGCCGTTPAHIAALAKRVRTL